MGSQNICSWHLLSSSPDLRSVNGCHEWALHSHQDKAALMGFNLWWALLIKGAVKLINQIYHPERLGYALWQKPKFSSNVPGAASERSCRSDTIILGKSQHPGLSQRTSQSVLTSGACQGPCPDCKWPRRQTAASKTQLCWSANSKHDSPNYSVTNDQDCRHHVSGRQFVVNSRDTVSGDGGPC